MCITFIPPVRWYLSEVVHKEKIIGIEAAAENDGVDMFEQAGVAAE